MQVRWWRSIRWRFIFWSLLVSLLATTLLAISVIVAVNYYYSVDETQRLTQLASITAQRIGVSYDTSGSVGAAVTNVLPNTPAERDQNPNTLLLVFNARRPLTLLYPRYQPGANTQSGLAGIKLVELLLSTTDPTLQTSDYTRLFASMTAAYKGTTTVGQIGNASPGASPRTFVTEPIFSGAQSGGAVIGILIALPRSAADNTTPTFTGTVTWFVLIASLVTTILAALVALLFSRTITRPLARLTGTAHVLASGDYSARVQTKSQSELGELAETVNKMASRLERDVEELRRQEQERRELILNITHDLATPLTAIAGLGESLLDGVNQDKEDYEQTGRVIVRETLRLRRLVKDLHTMAKVEAGTTQLQRKPLRLAALADESLAMLASAFERANVEPRNNIPYTLPVTLADHDMLMRVFTNLCDNAMHHTPPGGSVTIEARQVGNMVETAVTDTGTGIPTAALPRVFDRFFRADNSRQSSTGGSGLGLAIVRAIIEAHGGMIRAENSAQGGARIIFSLPVATFNTEQMANFNTLPMKPLS